MNRWAGFVAVALASLAAHAAGAELTLQQPNQYPSPTVRQPASEAMFDADYRWDANTLTGDWGGLRGALAEQGLVFGIRYVPVLMDNTQGGFDTGFFGAGPLGITTTVDTERLCGLEGGTLLVDWEFNHWYNGRFGPEGQFDPTGSYVGTNTNLLAPDGKRLNQVAQLFYEQSLWDDRLRLTFGKLDANSPFVDLEGAAAFQNSIAMFTSTLNPFLPTYPNEATALMATVGGEDDPLVGRFGWFDGTTAAYDPATGRSGPATGPRGPSTFFNNDGHWFLISQADLQWQVGAVLPGSLGVGGWVQTGRTATSGTNTDGVSDVPGWYVQGQQMVWSPDRETAAAGGGVTWLGQFGWSDPHKNPVHWSVETGVSATGIVPGRPADAAGLMFAYSDFTDDAAIYQSTQRDGAPGPAGGHEMSLEGFYIWQWTNWSYLQPGVMWVGDPGGGDPAPLDDLVLAYLLVGMEL